MTRLTIAIPSKGRLKEQTEDFLADCGFRLRQEGGERGYRASLDGLPDIELSLLSARETAERLLSGELHAGVTGEDLLNELASDLEAQAVVVRRLGFGQARVVVAVPDSWIDVDTMADLDTAARLFRTRHGRRLIVATKFHSLTRRFFARHAITDYRISDSSGATEAAPASGLADLIVDITTTGATLKANQLKILSDGEILDSQAALVVSRTADWSRETFAPLSSLLDHIAAREAAKGRKSLTLSTALTDESVISRLESQAGLAAADGNGGLTWSVRGEKASETARELSHLGHGPVSVGEISFVFSANNTVFAQLAQKLQFD